MPPTKVKKVSRRAENKVEPWMKEAWAAKWKGTQSSFAEKYNITGSNFHNWLNGRIGSRRVYTIMTSYLEGRPLWEVEASLKPLQFQIEPNDIRNLVYELADEICEAGHTKLSIITEDIGTSRIAKLDISKFWVICHPGQEGRLVRGSFGRKYFMISKYLTVKSVYYILKFALTFLDKILPNEITFLVFSENELADEVIFNIAIETTRTIYRRPIKELESEQSASLELGTEE